MLVRKLERKQQFFNEHALVGDEKLTVVMTGMETTNSICCRDHINITHTLAGIGVWTCVDFDICAHLTQYPQPQSYKPF
jgi:hypothetical protein